MFYKAKKNSNYCKYFRSFTFCSSTHILVYETLLSIKAANSSALHGSQLFPQLHKQNHKKTSKPKFIE